MQAAASSKGIFSENRISIDTPAQLSAIWLKDYSLSTYLFCHNEAAKKNPGTSPGFEGSLREKTDEHAGPS